MTAAHSRHIPATSAGVIGAAAGHATSYLPELTPAASHARAGQRRWGEAAAQDGADPTPRSGSGQVTGGERRRGEPGDRSGAWLRTAMAGLAVLAAAAAMVSYQAQFQLVAGYKHAPVVAAVQAAIPDVAALVFASLGIALALHGRRAVRARALNVAAVGTSVAMNALAAAPGWRALAVWVLPPTAYAVASDTLIGVVRAWVIARQQQLGEFRRHRTLHQNALHGNTSLARIGKASCDTTISRIRQISITMNDDCRISAQFEDYFLLSRIFLDLPPNRRATCETDHLQPVVSD